MCPGLQGGLEVRGSDNQFDDEDVVNTPVERKPILGDDRGLAQRGADASGGRCLV